MSFYYIIYTLYVLGGKLNMPRTKKVQKEVRPLVAPAEPIRVYSFAEFAIYQEEERLKHKVNAVAYPKKKICAN